MANVNKAILIGRLTTEVELKKLPSGSSVATFKLEIIESFKRKDGERQETQTLVDIEAWGIQAENCAKYLSKGREVLVEGRLRLDQWKDQEGKNRNRLLVRAKSVTFLDAPPEKRKASESLPEKKKETKKPDYPSDWDDVEVPPFG